MNNLENSISQRIAKLKARLEQQENKLDPILSARGLELEAMAHHATLKARGLTGSEPSPSFDLGPDQAELAMPTDPRQGWYLDAINVYDAWKDYSGDGVTVGVIDDGVNYLHEDLKANYNTSIDKDLRDGDSDANSTASSDSHGTKVAGVIGAASNGIGMVGVAYDSELAGFRIGFGSAGSISKTAAALDAAWKVSDVVNSSWSYSTAFQDNFSKYGYSSAGAALEAGVTDGRDGLGTIFVFAGGNARGSGDNVNYHNFQNSPYSIAVAATGSTGVYASWSNPGAALLVSAPGVGIQVTTDGGSYTTSSGTSFAAPIVAGVTALMLEANPDLGYRDVQEILAYSTSWNHKSSTSWDINGADNWNGGGLHFSHNYGFGEVDAKSAVRLAETWTLQRTAHNLTKVEASATPNRSITDGSSSGVSSTINVTKGLDLDAVQVQVAIDHANINDLMIVLESPSGTQAVLANRPNASGNLNFTFSANNFWGEDAAGTWKLTVVDKVTGNVGTLESWKLILHGDAPSSNDTYYYSNDYATLSDGARGALSDADGGINSINMSMVTSDVTLKMTAGMTSTLGGQPLTIAAGTVIQNAYLGDGNDSVYGNSANNIILGGRGNDVLDGGGGTNTAKYLGSLDKFDVIIVDANTIKVSFTGTSGIDEGADVLHNFQSFDFGGTVYSFQYLVDKFGEASPEPAPPQNSAPLVAQPISDKAIDEKTAFSFTVPTGTFSDADGDSLTYSATKADGSALPSWLEFDAATRTLSGTPGEADDGILDIRIVATDPSGAKASDTFRLTVRDVNEAPVVTQPIADQSVTESSAYRFVIPTTAFSDPDGDSLSYSVTKSDGTALPSWLSFDAATRTLSGTPGASDDGIYDIKVTATDPKGLATSDVYRLTVAEGNSAPVLMQPLKDQEVAKKSSFAFSIPSSAFSDPDGDPLMFKATMADGAALPSWLKFDASTDSFWGRPRKNDEGSYQIKVTAKDAHGAEVSDNFTLTVGGTADSPSSSTGKGKGKGHGSQKEKGGQIADSNDQQWQTDDGSDGSAASPWSSFLSLKGLFGNVAPGLSVARSKSGKPADAAQSDKAKAAIDWSAFTSAKTAGAGGDDSALPTVKLSLLLGAGSLVDVSSRLLSSHFPEEAQQETDPIIDHQLWTGFSAFSPWGALAGLHGAEPSTADAFDGVAWTGEAPLSHDSWVSALNSKIWTDWDHQDVSIGTLGIQDQPDHYLL